MVHFEANYFQVYCETGKQPVLVLEVVDGEVRFIEPNFPSEGLVVVSGVEDGDDDGDDGDDGDGEEMGVAVSGNVKVIEMEKVAS